MSKLLTKDELIDLRQNLAAKIERDMLAAHLTVPTISKITDLVRLALAQDVLSSTYGLIPGVPYLKR